MRAPFRSCLLLLFTLLAVSPAREDERQTRISVGDIGLGLGMPKATALAALRVNSNYLLTKMSDSRWVVSDKAAERAVAILTFDQDGRLWRVQKNWTPTSDSALPFAEALYDLAQQMPSENRDGQRHSCILSAMENSYVGPYAWVRDPGQPDLEVREIDLQCANKAIQIYINQTTDVTRGGPCDP